MVSWYSKNADYHDGAQQMLNRVLDMLGVNTETMDPIPDINVQLRNIEYSSDTDLGCPMFLVRFLGLVPVTTQIGTPMSLTCLGCVTAHEKSDKNDTIVSDDPKGAKIFCDGTVPSSQLLSQYEPENATKQRECFLYLKVPGPPETPAPKTPERIPKTDPVTAVTEETVEEVPDTDWVEEYLPPVSTVTTTASIAVVAIPQHCWRNRWQIFC